MDRVRQQADDEVLVVGHSSGAIMAAIIVARALRIAPDGCCFALCDPFAACGVERHASDGVHLKLLNPRFATLFDAAAYRALKRDKFKLHFQYLRATGKPGAYNYFDITAGPLSLVERFAATESVEDFTGMRPFG